MFWSIALGALFNVGLVNWWAFLKVFYVVLSNKNAKATWKKQRHETSVI